MSLHTAVTTSKKVGIGGAIGIGAIIIIVSLFRFGAFIIKTFTPPDITPPNQALGELPALEFAESVVDNEFTYVLNTVSGTLPTDFPDRLAVYPLVPDEPSLLNLDAARQKARSLGFADRQGKPISENSLGNGKYEWLNPTGHNKRLVFDIVTFDFTLDSQFLASLTTLNAARLGNEQTAIATVEKFLNSIALLPEDVDLEITKTPSGDDNYNTYPKLYDVINGAIIPTASLSNTKVIRVDLYQKPIEYDLDLGIEETPPVKIQLPIRYPKPPFSTMNFWVASGQTAAEVSRADFKHYAIDSSSKTPATYPIISIDEAFETLKSGEAYIASYEGLNQQILIDNIYLAYYLGTENQEYLMPIIVFEGQNGFFAYVSALKN